MSLIICGSIHWHEGHEWFSDYSRGRREIFMFGCSIMWAILPIRERRCLRYQSSPTSWDHFFCLGVFTSSEVLSKITSIRSKLVLPTAACWSREEKLALSWKRLLYDRHHRQIIHSIEVLNLMVDSNSQLVELDNSTTELHVPSRRKKTDNHIALFRGFWFPCSLMRFDDL